MKDVGDVQIEARQPALVAERGEDIPCTLGAASACTYSPSSINDWI